MKSIEAWHSVVGDLPYTQKVIEITGKPEWYGAMMGLKKMKEREILDLGGG